MSGETIYDPRNEERPTHYYGDVVRGLFVAEAVLFFLTQFVGTKLPFSSGGLILIILFLVIAAGITNPVQRWIHWANVIISIVGLLIFGGLALSWLNAGADLLSRNGIVVVLAVMFIASIYYATATVRGMIVPPLDTYREDEPAETYVTDPE